MGYRMIDLDQLYEIYRRHHSGQKNSQITLLGYDRKTIRKYLGILEGHDLTSDNPLCSKEEFVILCKDTVESRRPRNSTAASQFEPFLKEIKALISDGREPVKPKTAYRIICEKYGLDASYESFKRFFRKNFSVEQKPMIRIELEPGRELQVDYGKAGTLPDPDTGKMRVVQAFVATLSCSRYLFIEYVFTQDQQSFCESFVRAFEYFGGVPEFVSIDNLKSGVIKPHLYEPQLNRAFQELAEHYQTFIDPCRVATPTDKGKVERMVPLAREEFRYLKALHPQAGLEELNKKVLGWCRDEYGMKVHGTTYEKPTMVFDERERKHLKELPANRFEIPVWKEVKVHPDQFIQFEKKRYSLPSQYRGETLWVRKKGQILGIFRDSQLIRNYTITGKNVTYTESDFPEVVREMMNGGYASFILKQAEKLGKEAKELIESVLGPRAYLNTRRAQGVLKVLDEYREATDFQRICQTARIRKIHIPEHLRRLFEQEAKQLNLEIPRSATGDAMVRDANYYFTEDN
jgi:transposase